MNHPYGVRDRPLQKRVELTIGHREEQHQQAPEPEADEVFAKEVAERG